jgi:hypothetical protein
VDDRKVVAVTSSKPFENDPDSAVKNIADLETDSIVAVASRKRDQFIPHTTNSRACHDFTERRTVPTHYRIRTHREMGSEHLTSPDLKDWREDSEELNGTGIRTFALGTKAGSTASTASSTSAGTTSAMTHSSGHSRRGANFATVNLSARRRSLDRVIGRVACWNSDIGRVRALLPAKRISGTILLRCLSKLTDFSTFSRFVK